MARDTARRAELAEAATDYVLEHGLIGLSLRPLAAALGTSDRMLLYHFAGKDDLVATVLRTSSDRSVAEIRALPPSPRRPAGRARPVARDATRSRWTAASGCTSRPRRSACSGREPYVSVVPEANERWVGAMADHLVASGARRQRARRAVAPAGRDLHGPPARPAAGPGRPGDPAGWCATSPTPSPVVAGQGSA